jgi:hypothetical protein
VLRRPAGGERSQAAVLGLAHPGDQLAGVGPLVQVVVDGEPAECNPPT